MLWRKLGTILTAEIQWGRLAALAAGVAFLAVVTVGGAMSFLSMVVFSLGGIFIERMAPKRPYWNGLAYGLLSVFFYILLLELSIVGRGQPWPTMAVLLEELLSVCIVVLPQALIGTWIGVTIRRIGQAGRESKGQGEEAARPEGSRPAGEKGKPSARQTPREPTGRRRDGR